MGRVSHLVSQVMEHERCALVVADMDRLFGRFEGEPFAGFKLPGSKIERSHQPHTKGIARIDEKLGSPTHEHGSAVMSNGIHNPTNQIGIVG